MPKFTDWLGVTGNFFVEGLFTTKRVDNTTQPLVTATTTGTTTIDLSLGQSFGWQVNGTGQTFTLAVSNEPTNGYQADGYLDFIDGTVEFSGITLVGDAPQAGNRYFFTLNKNTAEPSSATYIFFTDPLP